MELSGTERRFLQELSAERPQQRRSAVALHFCTHFGIGSVAGRQVVYRESDFARAAQILAGLQAPATPLGAGASRADAAAFPGMSEKSGTRAPHADSVAVRPLGGCELAGRPLHAPARSYFVLTIEEATRVGARRLLFVENLETFRELERYRWLCAGEGTLAIWRGDRTFSPADALAVVRARTEPVWAFTDFDPAGLGIALGLPRLQRLALPLAQWLTSAARGARARQLFFDSLPQWEAALSRADHPEIRTAWELMLQLRAGVSQEAMRDAAD